MRNNDARRSLCRGLADASLVWPSGDSIWYLLPSILILRFHRWAPPRWGERPSKHSRCFSSFIKRPFLANAEGWVRAICHSCPRQKCPHNSASLGTDFNGRLTSSFINFRTWQNGALPRQMKRSVRYFIQRRRDRQRQLQMDPRILHLLVKCPLKRQQLIWFPPFSNHGPLEHVLVTIDSKSDKGRRGFTTLPRHYLLFSVC